MSFRRSAAASAAFLPLLVSALTPAGPRAQDAVAPDSAAAADSDTVVVVRKPTIPIVPMFLDGVEDTLFTATLDVPENRAEPGGRTIPLHIVIVPAIKKEKGVPPLFEIAGGPGVAATNAAAAYLDTALAIHRQRRDIILVDQRGTGQSNPLHCDELERASRLDEPFDPAAVQKCRDALAQVADLAHYTTMDAVRDLEDVRNALALDKIDLVGLSYGTLVVQAYMREYPRNVHAAVMLGAVPLGEKIPLHHAANAEEVLQRVLDDCDADPACGGAFPSLRREWSELLEMLDTGAVVAQYVDSTGTRGVPLQRGPFCEALRQMLVSATLQHRVPRMIHEAATGNFQPFLEAAMAGGVRLAQGMYLCVTCPEGTMRIEEGEIDAATARTFPGRYRVDRQMAACEIWDLAPVPDADLLPVSGTVPTLFLTGAMDYVTPVAWAQEVSSRLTNSLVLVVDDLGHSPDGLTNMTCYDEVIDRFFRSGSVIGLDAACLETMVPPPFTTE